MQESTIPIWIPSWDTLDKHPEVLSVLDVYERAYETSADMNTSTTAAAVQKTSQVQVINVMKHSFYCGSLSSFPVSSLINRLSIWLTEDATSATLAPEDINRLRRYVVCMPGLSAGRELIHSNEEKAFCDKHGLFAYLPIAEELINTHFPNVQEIQTELMKDPEAEGEWLLINVKVDADVDAVLDMYEAFTREWVARVPWPQRERIVIDYGIIDNP